MIEYANESVIKLLKQYDMLSKSLNFTIDLKQKNDICYQMTRIIQNVLEITNTAYEEKYNKVEKRSVYLMDEEKNRLLELINLINERRVYVNNQIINNKELTGIGLDIGTILGEDKLEDYKNQVKIIERYKNNIKLESVLKEEIQNLDLNIKKAEHKISNNKNLNKQLEEKMLRILDNALNKLSLFELQERIEQIDLAYTELGYSLEKAKENAKIARRDCSEDIISECDNMLASITLEYERYREKKLILQLINLYKDPVDDYEKLVQKREEMNNILLNITSSELYAMVGNELNKQYASIKLEQQDIATLKSLIEERDLKTQTLKEIIEENNSEAFKGLLANLLENEKKYQQKLLQEKKKKELERLEQEKLQEIKKQEEIAKRQKALEEERKKEIERRTKELLIEKKKPVLMSTKEETVEKETPESRKNLVSKARQPEASSTRAKQIFANPVSKTSPRVETRQDRNKTPERTIPREVSQVKDEFFPTPSSSKSSVTSTVRSSEQPDFFTRENKNTKVVDQGIPVIKNDKLENSVVNAQKIENNDKVFPEIPLEKKENIFPDMPSMNNNSSFFDENEFNDLSNYLEDDKKKSWF